MRRVVVLALLALLSAVPALAQEDSPGIAHTTGAIPTGDIHMGTNRIDGSNIVFTGGSLTGLSSLGATGSSALTGGGTLSGTFAGSPTLSGALSLTAAGTALSVTNNGTFGGTLATGTSSSNGLLLSGTTLSVTGTGNPNLNIRPLGTGSINFQVGATPVTSLQIVDPGANSVNFLRIQNGVAGNPALLSALGEATAGLRIAAGTGGNQGSLIVTPPMKINAGLQMQYNVALSSTNIVIPNQLGIYQLINASGNTAGGTMNPLDFNTFIINDTVNTFVNGHSGWAYAIKAGFDGYRNGFDWNMTKDASSITGDFIFEANRHFLHISHGEEGTAPPGGKPMESEATITASQSGTTLTVTAASANVISASAPQTFITGNGIRALRVTALGTGTGGVGTYTMEASQDYASQSLFAGNYAGSYEVDNSDINCDGGPRVKGCQLAEWDLRLSGGPALWKTGLSINYALFDAYHGEWDDCAFCVAGTGAPGSGGLNIFSVGTNTHAWPIDNARTDTAMLKAQPSLVSGAFSGTTPFQYKSGMVVNAEIVGCLVACWRSPGFQVDPTGEVKAGPLTITYDATGIKLSASRVTGTSAVVTSGGANYRLNDWVEDPMGGLWSVPSIVGGGSVGTATSGALTLIQKGYASTCPAASSTFIPISAGSGLKGTVTCATSNGIIVGDTGNKLGFYGTAAIVKATPSGACAGNTGCQAIRDALANLGLINGGSISN
jgi:hypothetical protein